MTLDEWLQGRDRGFLARLVRSTGISFGTIAKARRRALTRMDVAEQLSAATGNAVTALSMLDPRVVEQVQSLARELRKSA
jgi:hypothetical protein